MTEKNRILTRVASLSHIQWSTWMKYLFSKCDRQQDGTMIIPKWAVERWQRQMNTDYKDLTPEEQESDEREAEKYIRLVLQMIQKEILE